MALDGDDRRSTRFNICGERRPEVARTGDGEYWYKAAHALVEQTCSCKADGTCTLKVSRAELDAAQVRFKESMQTLVPHMWPAIMKRMASMSNDDAHAYGERLAKDYIDSLPRSEVLLWAHMLTSCWGTSPEPTRPVVSPAADVPHDGSLRSDGEIFDLKNGKLDEAGGIAEFVHGCRDAAPGNPNATPFCGCLADYLRVSPPSVIRTLTDSSETGDASKVFALPGVQRCGEWVTNGSTSPSPFLRKGMKSSVAVEAQFMKCRATMAKGKPTPSGVVFCNRLVATTP